MAAPDIAIRQVPAMRLTQAEISAVRELLRAAFADDGEGFTDEDWEHTVGGTYFLLEEGAEVISCAAVVQRELQVHGRPLRTGYVEAVATRVDVQARGHGTRLMRDVNEFIRAAYQLGALSTGSPGFYARVGWEPWLGSTAVRTERGHLPTPEDDGGIMVLPTPATPRLDRRATISCEWRHGDVW